ncbi:MAG: MATE family efflux transporter [Acidiferrobacterales bacterium]|nr:MATE family efflux transporter [Acidiferrobacterales bacterium]
MHLPIKDIWRLGLPLSLGLVIQMIIIMVDSAFAGNVSYIALAAVALGGGAFFILFLLIIGFTVGASVRAGQALGAGDEEAMFNCFRQGALVSVAFGVVLSWVLLELSPLMLFLRQDPEVVALAEKYLLWITWTLPLQALMVLVRDYFAVIDQPWKSVMPAFLTLLLNAFLDYCLATGNLGFPALGVTGIGIASLISNFFLVLMLLHAMGWNKVRQLFAFAHPDVWKDRGMVTLCVVSIPIAITLVLEEAFFSGTVFLAGAIGAAEQAAHQIVINLVGTSFLFNTGFGIAISIVIGKHVGAKRYDQILPTVKAGWIVAQIFTIPFGLILLFFSDLWIGLFLDQSLSSNQPTILFVKSVLWITFFMLFVDTIWLVLIEGLHGMLDTTFPAISAFIAYWLVGGPLALWATSRFPQAFLWIWIAMFIAAVLLTVMVYLRLRVKLRQFTQAL